MHQILIHREYISTFAKKTIASEPEGLEAIVVTGSILLHSTSRHLLLRSKSEGEATSCFYSHSIVAGGLEEMS